jgi:citrate synthase
MMMNTIFKRVSLVAKPAQRNFTAILRQKMEVAIANRQAEIKTFNKEHGNTVVDQVTVGQIIGGMRGIPGMLYETSKLDPAEGISYRGTKLFDIRANAPTTVPGGEPIPEGVLWLLLTGELPSASEVADFKQELFRRGELTQEEETMIRSFPINMHAMTQFSMGVLACQPRSHFMKAYQGGVHKSKYWESTLEDCLDLCARVSRIAAIVYANKYGNNRQIAARDSALDYGANFANQLGFTDR